MEREKFWTVVNIDDMRAVTYGSKEDAVAAAVARQLKNTDKQFAVMEAVTVTVPPPKSQIDLKEL